MWRHADLHHCCSQRAVLGEVSEHLTLLRGPPPVRRVGVQSRDGPIAPKQTQRLQNNSGHKRLREGCHELDSPSGETNSNQSRMCGKGVGLGLFPSDLLESPSYDFDALPQIAWRKMTVENFVRIVLSF